MATKTIAWEIGGGYITLTYTGTGSGPVSVQSDANELYEERQQTVRIVTTSGSPEKAVELLVRQKGKSYPVGTEFDFSYTGSVQEITLPPGKYKLQCWGAQGGSVSGSYSATGSKGGYSEGVLTVTEPTTIYVFVGGKGTDSSTSSTSGTANGGWNGGGASVRYSSYSSGGTSGYSYPRPGGGATDMCLVTSSMGYSSGRTNRSSVSLLSRFIVAGGGAGASATYRSEESETTSWDSIYSGGGSSYTNTTVWGGRKFFMKSISITGGKKYKFSASNPSSSGVWSYAMEWYGSSGYISTSASTSATAPSGATSLSCYVITNSTADEGFSGSSCTFYIYVQNTHTGTSSSSAKSNSAQQGGGTNGKGQYPGTQSSAGSGGAFGLGANQTTTNYRHDSGAGGGGWYGGGCSHSDSSTSYVNYSGGGSGFVNTAANAGYRPSGYTGIELDSGSTKDGSVSFPSTSGGTETGHSGNGYARITVLDENYVEPASQVDWSVRSGTWTESSNSSAADGRQWTCSSPGANGSTVIRCTFSGLSSITFRCRYQGESNYDYLTVGNLDSGCTRSSYKQSLKGSSGSWKSITYTLSDTDEHYVEFCYSKDGSVDTSPDNADVYIESYN